MFIWRDCFIWDILVGNTNSPWDRGSCFLISLSYDYFSKLFNGVSVEVWLVMRVFKASPDSDVGVNNLLPTLSLQQLHKAVICKTHLPQVAEKHRSMQLHKSVLGFDTPTVASMLNRLLGWTRDPFLWLWATTSAVHSCLTAAVVGQRWMGDPPASFIIQSSACLKRGQQDGGGGKGLGY